MRTLKKPEHAAEYRKHLTALSPTEIRAWAWAPAAEAGRRRPAVTVPGSGIQAMSDPNDINCGGGMRLDIDKLLVEHQNLIEELRNRTNDVLLQDPATYDDIFLLRYVLTHSKKGGMDAAEDAVRKTITWRTENDVVLKKVAATGKAPHEDVMMKFNTIGYACDLAGYEPVFVVRTGHCNQKGLMSTLTIDQACDWLHYSKELYWQLCDQRTRKTRKLIKVAPRRDSCLLVPKHRAFDKWWYVQMITVIDWEGLSLFGGDSRFHKALGKSSEMSALYYPQVLDRRAHSCEYYINHTQSPTYRGVNLIPLCAVGRRCWARQ